MNVLIWRTKRKAGMFVLATMLLAGCHLGAEPSLLSMPTALPSRASTPTQTATSTFTPTPNPTDSPTHYPIETPTTIPTRTALPPVSGRILFTRFTSSGADIFSINADGSGETRLTSGPGWHTDATWSPDGSRILYVYSTQASNSNEDLYLMNTDGSGVTRLIDSPRINEGFPHWSPHGTKIVFIAYPSAESIHVINADGSRETGLRGVAGSGSLPYWSPDGTKILFQSKQSGNWEIYVMNADGSRVTNLSNDPGMDTAVDSWSPDSSRVAFDSTRNGRKDIFVVNVDGSGLTQITKDPAEDLYPHWSPDGSRIAFLSERDGSQDIWLMDPDGGNLLRLTNTPELEGYLVWSPDGTRLVFEVSESGNSDLYIINKDGSGLTRLIHSQGIADPDWAAGGSSLADPTCGAGWTRLKVLQYARVRGGGVPNRVRSEPKVADNQIGLLQPGAVAQIIQGPVCVGGLVFWKIMNDTIPGGEGWTAEGDGTEYWLEPFGQ